MLTIGAFARLGGVSVKTLRHYAAIGLLVPAQVDTATGYRSYAPEQLFLLNHILVLKDLGLSLVQIGALLEEGVPLDQLHGMLRLKRAELHDQIAAGRPGCQRGWTPRSQLWRVGCGRPAWAATRRSERSASSRWTAS
jgi:DNA-binding transcriptional MerR regulator